MLSLQRYTLIDYTHEIYKYALSFLQASDEASLRALEALMTEFFAPSTTNGRKREIGKKSKFSHSFLLQIRVIFTVMKVHSKV